MRRVGIIAVAQSDFGVDPAITAPEMVFDVAQRAVEASGLARGDIDFTVSGSSDVLEGRSFNFVYALEAMGAYPPTHESHVEMDGAWAAWYAWLKILSGQATSALVISWAKCSEGSLSSVLNTQLDPMCLAPLGIDHVATAALQADAWSHRTGRATGSVATPPVTDGACAIVMASEQVARRVCDRPAWIAAADHRSDTGALGHRDLSRLPSAERAVARARELAGWARPDVAELAASFAHQEPMLVEALGLDDSTAINPSGRAPAAEPMLVTGLVRLGEAALQVTGRAGDHQVPGASRALAHAASGHALQQNLVWLLEGDAQ